MEEKCYYKEMFELAGMLHYHFEHNQKKTIAKGEGAILYLLQKNPEGLTPGELSEALRVGSGRIASLLKTMEQKKLLKRKIDSEDRRKVIVTLTQEGSEFIQKLRNRMRREIDTVHQKMGAENFELFLKLCRQFCECFLEADRKERLASND